MSAREFLDPEARQRVAQAVAALEQTTAAEVVVAVRKTSGHYRHADYLLGALLALAGLLVFLFHPAPFDEDLFPVAEVALFAAGAMLSVSVAPLRRLLVAPLVRLGNVRTAARAAFHDLGVSRTRQRTGLLVYVALFEREVEVVTDTGLAPDQLGPAWSSALTALTASVRDASLDAFVSALASLGPPLAKAHPRAADDVNELPDEVHA